MVHISTFYKGTVPVAALYLYFLIVHIVLFLSAGLHSLTTGSRELYGENVYRYDAQLFIVRDCSNYSVFSLYVI